MTAVSDTFYTLRPGRISYRAGLALQEELLAPPGPATDLMLLLEHDPVITLGRAARDSHLLSSVEVLAQQGIDLCHAARGGDMTYHGPGQLVGYPLFNLDRRGRDLHLFLRNIEQALIDALQCFDVDAGRCAGRTGIWVGAQKLASIGLGVRRWWSWHGFALNIDIDLGGFNHIVPCGLTGVQMTSLAQLLPQAPTLAEVETAVITSFASTFNLEYAGSYERKLSTPA
ncbi:lipoyl(octanoyl) transferase LipB [Geopsychrobacter electrodiphilus]|uniref:lipoyl(octanoyl) transferase LipB n=1 Tax=Geopsychrobacter electrodiphilus TaxID=225196 RepID=UPI000382790F|nr:lipoyl(octanoyl) transferase LipB [Geopsychrobacter electrodiphilus]